jgi:predicted membrane-bound spermidine synthase
MRREVIQGAIVVFIASFCTMVIELVAGRIMAPYVGVSLYTWTSIIGVVLAGISIGAYVGGVLADRFPTPKTLGWLLFFSGVGALSISPLTDAWGRFEVQTSLMLRILIITAVIFFVPSSILGMISPVVVRLSLDRLDRSGNVVGRIYAFSTLGSILGTFATGFFLISWMGTRNILLLMGAILMVSSPFFGGAFLKKKVLLFLFPVLFVFLWSIHGQAFRKPHALTSYFFEETDYFTVELKRMEEDDRTLEVVVLDNLIHSYVDRKDPLHLQYAYERVYSELTAWKAAAKPDFQALLIGGGGYTFPRYLEMKYSRCGIDVIEIDPRITQIAFQHLGLSPRTRIRTFNYDARWFLMNFPRHAVYDFIIGDAFNDLTVPYHLTTKEFSEQIRSLLKPDGLYIVNIIDNFPHGLFWPSYVRTLQQVFGPRNVCLVADSDFSQMGVSTMIVVASPAEHRWEAFARETRPRSFLLMPEDLNRELKDRFSVVLTDDYVPVDNLLAPIFEERYGRKIARK